MERKLKLIKNRSDIGAGTRGADMGIDAIEIAAINQGNDYFNRFEFEDVKTHNESIYNMVRNSFAKRIEDVYEQCTRVSKSVKKNLEAHYFPLAVALFDGIFNNKSDLLNTCNTGCPVGSCFKIL